MPYDLKTLSNEKNTFLSEILTASQNYPKHSLRASARKAQDSELNLPVACITYVKRINGCNKKPTIISNYYGFHDLIG